MPVDAAAAVASSATFLVRSRELLRKSELNIILNFKKELETVCRDLARIRFFHEEVLKRGLVNKDFRFFYMQHEYEQISALYLNLRARIDSEMTDEFKCLIWVKKKAKMVCNWRKNVTELKEIMLRTEELIGSIVIFGMNRIDESSFLANPSSRTFVKVYKSGSFGRSLDIAKFSSYNELRSELAHMFGLEGQLEDPLRSGWQIVFVDRENDVLLLGDDLWPEFVNSVWCIKILSPQEVQQMGKQGIELLNSVPVQRLSSTSCDNANKIQEI